MKTYFDLYKWVSVIEFIAGLGYTWLNNGHSFWLYLLFGLTVLNMSVMLFIYGYLQLQKEIEKQ